VRILALDDVEVVRELGLHPLEVEEAGQ